MVCVPYFPDDALIRQSEMIYLAAGASDRDLTVPDSTESRRSWQGGSRVGVMERTQTRRLLPGLRQFLFSNSFHSDKLEGIKGTVSDQWAVTILKPRLYTPCFSREQSDRCL